MKSSGCFLAIAVLLGSLPALGEDNPPRLGPDFLVNARTQGPQFSPDVARTAGGGFVAVWHNGLDLKGRLFHASGAPAGDEFAVVPEPLIRSRPHVASAPDGRFTVVWADFQDVFFRRFDRQGNSLGDPVRVSPRTLERHLDPDAALDAAGNLAVVWVKDETVGDLVLLRRFGPDGAPLGEAVQVNESFAFTVGSPHVALNETGSLLASWDDTSSATVWARRFDGPRGVWAPQVQVTPRGNDFQMGSAPVLYPEGDGAVAFFEFPAFPPSADVRVQRLDAAGGLLGGTLTVASGAYVYHPPDAAVDPAGRTFVVWSTAPRTVGEDLVAGQIFGRLFDRSWNALGLSVPVSTATELPDREPAVAAMDRGGFVAVWSNGDHDPALIIFEAPSVPRDGRDGSSFGVFGQVLGTPRCLAGSEVLCLGQEGRFEVRVTWKKPGGETGGGHSHPLTVDTGALWFFGPDNLELLIKVLDARPVNGHFWVYYGALSNVEYTITVTDTVTGKERTYQNPAGQFLSRADVTAFPAASSGSSLIAPASIAPPAPAGPAPFCNSSGAGLCLSERFLVRVDFTDPRTGAVGHGQGLPLTADTVAFWFFGPDNLEVMIKVLDARPVNGKFWVFYGGLSDVAYTITVTDTRLGQVRSYRNDRGHLASGADVEAFPLD